MTGRTKVYELAKELGQESRHVLEVAQRLGIHLKTATSFIGSEEARLVREYYRKSSPSTTVRRRVVSAPKAKAATESGQTVTERRVGRTVIRRRSKAAPAAAPPVEEVPEKAPVEEVKSAPVEAPKKEAPAAETKVSAEPAATEEAKAPAKEKKEASAPKEKAPARKPPARKQEATPAPAAPRKKRAAFPSIIKKVSTEKHLGDTIGPKRTAAERPARSEGSGGEAGAASSSPKRVREITMTSPTEAAAKENKRRILQRQSGVFRSSDYLKRELVHSAKKKKAGLSRPAQKTMITTPAAHKRVVEMQESISIEDLAHGMSVKLKEVRKKLAAMGSEAEGDLDHDTAVLLASEFGFQVKQNTVKEDELIPTGKTDDKDLKPRPPVVTIMGHVDHGKTSLLDKIRKSNVVDGEAGGITQHIGAYTVMHKKAKIAFVDTPGHEAFTAMRARGAQVTDIVVLVVSATEGVMPQTVESINHSKAAGVPIIVAVNKNDLPDANPEKVKQTMANYELAPEEWGGDTMFCNVSAKTGDGIDGLLEAITLNAEMLELKANPKGPASGVVIESRMEKGRGAVATLLIQSGSLSRGDLVVCGTTSGKVRAVNDFQGKPTKAAGPSEPVEVIGLPEVLEVGHNFHVFTDDKAADTLLKDRQNKARIEAAEAAKPKMTLEEMLANASSEVKELRVVLKADVKGSLEAVKEALSKFPAEKVKIKYLHLGVGAINETDVMLASASDGVVFGFAVRPDGKAKRVAEAEGVDLRAYRVIYELVDEVKKLLEGLVDKKVVEKTIGRAEVKDVFQVPKLGAVAGSSVTDGKIHRGCLARLLRDSRVIYEGKVASLRRFKDDVREVSNGYECGIGLENFDDIKVGDHLEAYEKEEIAGTL